MSTGNERLGPTPRRFGIGVLIFVAILGLLGGYLIAPSIGARPAAKGLDLLGASKVNVAANPGGFSPANFVELAKRVKPGVVNISTTKVVKGGGRVFRHFSPPPGSGIRSGISSARIFSTGFSGKHPRGIMYRGRWDRASSSTARVISSPTTT